MGRVVKLIFKKDTDLCVFAFRKQLGTTAPENSCAKLGRFEQPKDYPIFIFSFYELERNRYPDDERDWIHYGIMRRDLSKTVELDGAYLF